MTTDCMTTDSGAYCPYDYVTSTSAELSYQEK